MLNNNSKGLLAADFYDLFFYKNVKCGVCFWLALFVKFMGYVKINKSTM